MKIQATTNIGKTKYVFQIEDEDMEALHLAAVLGNAPDYCSLCKNDKFFALDSNKDKEGNVYVNVVCKKCFAKAKLGRYKAKGFFWHKFEKYVPKGTQKDTQDSPPDNPFNDDIPPAEEPSELPF